ncbi:MAG: hypothetical protein WCF67_06535 [Chitinophagaceae bacterium]
MAKSSSNIKKERFRTVASRRVQKVLENLESLSKCANKATYEYTQDDINKMLRAIKEQVRLLEMSFSSSSKSGKLKFEF